MRDVHISMMCATTAATTADRMNVCNATANGVCFTPKMRRIAVNETNPNARTARTDPNAAPGLTKMKKKKAKQKEPTETKRKLTMRTPKVLLSG